MSNTALCCELVIKKLRENAAALEALGADGEEAVRLLTATRTQSVSGFHMSRSMILQASIIRGEHQPRGDEFEMSALFEDLGIVGMPRFVLDEVCTDTVRTDKQVLTCILFNATQNASTHGEKGGPVRVTATVTDGELRVTVANRPGANHDKLLAALHAQQTPTGEWELLGADLLGVERNVLKSTGCGAEGSTFQGLNEMAVFASAFRPPADTHVWVLPEGVLFELRVPVTVVAPPTSGDAHGDDEALALPKGLAFVCCDDDSIPRMCAGVVVDRAEADAAESLILGESYEEVAGLVERVIGLAARLGDSRVVCIFDQNLDFDAGGFSGTGLVGELRARGFGGLLVIQSANDEADDERIYVAAGADGSIGKAVKGGVHEMLSHLARLWHAKYGAQARTATADG